MKWIPKYQRAGKLNFKLPQQQSKEDQEVARNAQSLGILNPTISKSKLRSISKDFRARYNKLSTKERLALAKKNMPHSEIVTVKDQHGNIKTSTNPKAGAMSGADPVGEFIVGTAVGNLGLDLGKMALSKMGKNAVSHWARNSLLNETAGDLTKNIATPLIESEAIPLEDGFVYRTFTPSHGGWVKDGGVYNRSYGIGDVKVKDGKYYSVRQAHFNNPDKLWWDKFGHNRGRVVQVTKESNTQSLQDAVNNGFNLNYGYFEKGYRLSDPIKINEVINYKLDPLTNTMVPSMPGKIITNKQSLSEIFDAPDIQLNNTGFKDNISLKFFERPIKLTKAEKLGIPKADRNNVNFNKSLQTPHTFTQPYLNNLGEYNFSNDAVDNPIFGKYIGDGSEQIVYEDALSPGKVLKIYNDIGHSSYSSLRNFVTQYQKRNNIPYQLPTSFEGFVTNNNKMYPVFSQQYAPSISEVEFPDAISALRTQLKGYSESTPEVFERQGRQILDLQPGNISRLKNKYYFIDAFPEGFKQGGKLSKNLKVNEVVFN